MKSHAWTLLALAPLALAPLGCYRATGFARAALIAEEIPAVGGDRVPGMKSMAGTGDYYVGNDFVGLAVDGSPAGQGVAGAPGGGSVIDAGFIVLDSSFRRAPAPCDMLDRMTTVLNQDPSVQLVFEEFEAVAAPGVARLDMRGRVHDPGHRLQGASWDADGFALGLGASASISLGDMDRRYTIETAVTNRGASPVGVLSIGDFVYQRGGGFRILAPVCEDFSGAPISTWGVDMPGTDFSDPLRSSVRSGPVVLMGTEPGSDTLDCHVSLGLMPLGEGQDRFLVASDPQRSLTESRPVFPERFVAGRLPADGPLAPGGSLTHSRRLYVRGGASGALEYLAMLFTTGTPNQGTGLLNEMYQDMLPLRGRRVSTLRFWLEGTGARLSPVPSELRFERYEYDGEGACPATDEDQSHWRLERLEWMEPADSLQNIYVPDSSGAVTAVASTPDTYFGVFLPEGAYRIVSSNASQRSVFQQGTNFTSAERPNTPTAIVLEEAGLFSLREPVSPEHADTHSPYGSRTSVAMGGFGLATRGNDSAELFVQPMRFAFLGRGGGPSPRFMRRRSITSTFDANIGGPRLPGPPVSETLPPGSFHFQGGDSAFGVQMEPRYSSLSVPLPPGHYDAYGARGPLSALEQFAVDARPLGGAGRLLTVFHAGPPAGWLALDLPGPSMATTGGALPCEQMASALADGVHLVCMAETDHQRDELALYREFKASLGYIWELNKNVGVYPLAVGGRQSELKGFGTATALFVPADPSARLGGARPSGGWTLADFLAQAEGGFNVVNRPRGPRGLFTQKGFNPALPLPQAAPWWREEGKLSRGRQNGGFDALEIMSAGAVAESGVGAWWQEFRAARSDWFSIISQQAPGSFTKAVGFSGGRFTQDTPAGLARTWIFVGENRAGQGRVDAVMDSAGYYYAMEAVLDALRAGAAVASTGPLLLVSVGEGEEAVGPGGLATLGGSPRSVQLRVTLVAPDWVPVEEIRVVVNGAAVVTLAGPKAALERSAEDSRLYTGTIAVPMPAAGDAWLVAEAGAPLGASGPHRPDAVAWNALMKGIYPVAVANPIFIDLDGGGYAPPGI